MINAQKPEKIALGSLLNKIGEGCFVIPDFQREFEWAPWDVRELIKSIFLDYYIGTLLLWKGKKANFDALSCEPIYGLTDDSSPSYIVLDGQQRLTAIYYACYAPNIHFPKRKSPCFFYIDIQLFVDQEYDEAFNYDWLSQRWQKVMESHEKQYHRHVFPLSLMGQGSWKLISWLQGYKTYWTDKRKNALEQGDLTGAKEAEKYTKGGEVFAAFMEQLHQEYQVSYIELDQEIGVEKVCDIFTQINSRGVRLDIFDLLNAMLKPKDIQLKKMWREASGQLEFANTSKMNVYVLQVMSILLQSYCSPKYLYYLIPETPKPIRRPDGSLDRVILIESGDKFREHWNKAVKAIEDALKILRSPHDYGAVSPVFIPYPTIIPIFTAIRQVAKSITSKDFADVNRKIRKWYWASIFTTRYSSAAESTSARDFKDLTQWFEDDDSVPSVIAEFTDGFRGLDLKSENKKGSAVYNAVFNLLVIKGAKDWATLESPAYDALDDHHIIPVSWGMGHVGRQIHSILNRTPLSEDTNRKVIRNRLPNQYLPEMISKYDDTTVKSIMANHLISEKAIDILLRKDFRPDDFQAFLEERQKSILQAIQDLLIKERIALDPSLRELDSDIEKVELALRQVIVEVLREGVALLPPHIKVKAEERIQKMLQKDAAKDPSDYKTLSRYLEFSDLRECQATIISKSLWSHFESRFGQKDMLQKRFDQLAELRNVLRHSRTVDEVVKKDGEAAVLWFSKVLGLEH